MRRALMLASVVTVAIAALDLGESAAAPSSWTVASGLCISTGARTVLNGQSTTKYEIKLTGITCAFAKRA